MILSCLRKLSYVGRHSYLSVLIDQYLHKIKRTVYYEI